MKFLRNMLDLAHPLFGKGGKLEKLYPLYEAGDTFLYTPGNVAKGLIRHLPGLGATQPRPAPYKS